MTPSILIRRACSEDQDSFLDLLTGLAEFEKLTPPDESARERLIQHAFAEHPPFEAWLAFIPDHHEAVGLAILTQHYSTFLAKPTLYLEDLYVREEFRQRGIGNALLKHVIQIADERGCGRVEWTALDWNQGAREIYENRLGAKPLHDWVLYRMEENEIRKYLALH